MTVTPCRPPLDPGDMLGAVAGLPDQLAAAWADRHAFALAPDTVPVDGVLVAGMGGSAIGGELVAAVYACELRVPMAIVRHYDLPAWAGLSVIW